MHTEPGRYMHKLKLFSDWLTKTANKSNRNGSENLSIPLENLCNALIFCRAQSLRPKHYKYTAKIQTKRSENENHSHLLTDQRVIIQNYIMFFHIIYPKAPQNYYDFTTISTIVPINTFLLQYCTK